MSFMEALNRQDFEGAKKYATAESASILDMTKGMGTKKEDSGKFDLNKLEVGEAKIESDIATIPVKVKENGSCGNNRGIKCFFNDTYTKKKEAKPASKKK